MFRFNKLRFSYGQLLWINKYPVINVNEIGLVKKLSLSVKFDKLSLDFLRLSLWVLLTITFRRPVVSVRRLSRYNEIGDNYVTLRKKLLYNCIEKIMSIVVGRQKDTGLVLPRKAKYCIDLSFKGCQIYADIANYGYLLSENYTEFFELYFKIRFSQHYTVINIELLRYFQFPISG